jgi:addiction module RelB/DinJ family antitoxin
MAANQHVQVRIDGAVKEEAAAVLATMGLTGSDAVRLLLTKVAHDKALPRGPARHRMKLLIDRWPSNWKKERCLQWIRSEHACACCHCSPEASRLLLIGYARVSMT